MSRSQPKKYPEVIHQRAKKKWDIRTVARPQNHETAIYFPKRANNSYQVPVHHKTDRVRRMQHTIAYDIKSFIKGGENNSIRRPMNSTRRRSHSHTYVIHIGEGLNHNRNVRRTPTIKVPLRPVTSSNPSMHMLFKPHLKKRKAERSRLATSFALT